VLSSAELSALHRPRHSQFYQLNKRLHHLAETECNWRTRAGHPTRFSGIWFWRLAFLGFLSSDCTISSGRRQKSAGRNLGVNAHIPAPNSILRIVAGSVPIIAPWRRCNRPCHGKPSSPQTEGIFTTAPLLARNCLVSFRASGNMAHVEGTAKILTPAFGGLCLPNSFRHHFSTALLTNNIELPYFERWFFPPGTFLLAFFVTHIHRTRGVAFPARIADGFRNLAPAVHAAAADHPLSRLSSAKRMAVSARCPVSATG